MTLAIMGGTFNPIHIGHLLLAQEVQSELGFDTILFTPSYTPAHKPAPDREAGGASPEDRLEMVRAAIDGVPGFRVEDCEIRRGGVSYTVDTLDHVLRSFPLSGKPGLVIGDDLLAGFRDWREPLAIADRSRLVVAHRAHAEELEFPYPHTYCRNPLVPISSSLVRDRIRRRLPVRFMVPDAVLRYIEAHGLYR